jgi:hypothetical protein
MNATAWRRRGRAIACAAMLSSVPLGCGGGTQLRAGVVYDYPVYYVEEPPPRIHYYPQTRYHGRPAYLVEDRWYYSTPRGWAYFREEPRELRAYRQQRHVRRAAPIPQRRYRADEPERRSYREPRDTRPEEPTEGRRRRHESD